MLQVLIDHFLLSYVVHKQVVLPHLNDELTSLTLNSLRLLRLITERVDESFWLLLRIHLVALQDLLLAVIVGMVQLPHDRLAIVRVGHEANEFVRVERHLVELFGTVQVPDFIGVLRELPKLLVLSLLLSRLTLLVLSLGLLLLVLLLIFAVLLAVFGF